MILVTRIDAKIGEDVIRSSEKRRNERRIPVYLCRLHGNLAGFIEITGTVGLSMIAASALALVSSGYGNRSGMWAARKKCLVGAYCHVSLAYVGT